MASDLVSLLQSMAVIFVEAKAVYSRPDVSDAYFWSDLQRLQCATVPCYIFLTTLLVLKVLVMS